MNKAWKICVVENFSVENMKYFETFTVMFNEFIENVLGISSWIQSC